MSDKNLARIISLVFSPPVWLPVLLFALILKTELPFDRALVLLPLLILLQVVVPVFALYFGEEYGLISTWDIPIRRQRYLITEIICASYVVSLIPVWFFGTPLLFNIMLTLTGILGALTVITRFTKISFHMSINTVGVILLNVLYGWHLAILFLIIPAVYFARLTLHRHTPSQLLMGVGVSAILLLSGLRLFGYV